jgi:hypothetical protein
MKGAYVGVKVSLTRSEDGVFTIDLGSQALPRITFDPMALDPEVRQEEHMGARLLLAAALTCYVNTMAGDLARGEASRVAPITAQAEIQKEKGSDLRTRYTHIEINLETEVAEADRAIFEAVRNSLLNGSLVTSSLEEEIDIDYNIEAA